jgi:WD40 repeat protein/tRNA A-37 threonylcarbamoyl transferase component Bud32
VNPQNAAQIDAICDSFEKNLRAGHDASLVKIVEEADEPLRIPLAQQLMLIDAEFRRGKYGKAPSVEEYAAKLNVDTQLLWAVADTFTKAAAEETATFIAKPAADQATFLGDEEAPEQSQQLESDWDVPTAPAQPKVAFSIRGYRILSELGRGGMGVVYKARQLRPGRLVAIKTIHAPRMASQEHLLRFQAEAEAAGRLDHRGIVPVYEVGEDNGVHFFSMGFVEGTDLDKKARDKILSCGEAAEICRDIADALEYAHQKGVIHRDIKPQNILIGTDGKPRITDFGLAKLANQDAELTGSGQIMGTAAYMPPEQATGKTSEAGPTADVYALGATLYRCVTGRPPFQAASAMEILRQVVDDEPIPPRRLNREVDADIETLCLKCLEKDPARRFASAGELAAELGRYLNHEPILSRPIGPLIRAWRWCQRRPYVAASIGLAVALFAAITVGIPYMISQQSQLALAKSEQQIQALKLKEQTLATEQANQLAATQEYHATVREVREQRVKPTPGWTWSALDLLQKAAESPAAGKDLVELRSLIAETMTTLDVREAGRLEKVRAAGSMAISQDRRFLAVGDWAGVPTSELRIYEIAHVNDEGATHRVELKPHRVCSFFTGADKAKAELGRLMQGLGLAGTKTEREGLHAAAFSPDGTRVAVGTRNGRIISWDVTSDPPQELFNVAPADAVVDGMHKIAYSPDGKTIYAHWHHDDVRSFQSFNADTGEVGFSIGKESWDFSLLPGGTILLSEHRSLDRLSPADLTDAVSLGKHDGQGDTWVSAAMDRLLRIVSQRRIVVGDAVTGHGGILLEKTGGLHHELHFSGDTSVVCGGWGDPGRLVVWDGLRGNILHEVPVAGGEWPQAIVDGTSNHVFAAEGETVGVYKLRAPVPLSATVVESKDLAKKPMPMTVYAEGADSVRDFSLSPAGDFLAIVEHMPRPLDAGARTRIRKIDVSTGEEVNRWLCTDLAEIPGLISGVDVACLGNGDRLAIASTIPGNLLVLSDNGFEVPGGIGIDVVRWPATIEDGVAKWNRPAETGDQREVCAAVAVRIPRALYQSRETLEFELTTAKGNVTSVANDQILESRGWSLLTIGSLTPEDLSGGWTLKATLKANKLALRAFESDAAQSDDAVWVGDVYLFPVADDHGKEVLLSPLAGRGDGGLSCTVRSSWLHQWNGDLGQQTAKPWQDFINSQEDVGAVSAAYDQTFVGSDSGIVVLLDAAGTRRLLQDGEKASTNTKDRITATAITPDGAFGVAGSAGGQLRMYDLQSPENAPAFIMDAHSRSIVAVSVSNDGQLVASAAEDGVLRFWKRLPIQLELIFEMTNDAVPVIEMQLSPNGEFLYLLRQGERGVRRLDIERLMTIFKSQGL